MDQDYGSIVLLCSWLFNLALALSSAEVFWQQLQNDGVLQETLRTINLHFLKGNQRQTDKGKRIYVHFGQIGKRVFDFVTMSQF